VDNYSFSFYCSYKTQALRDYSQHWLM